MTVKAEPRLAPGTVVAEIPCEGCALDGVEKMLPVKVGQKGKLYAYCMQTKKPGPKTPACGWRCHFPRRQSDMLIDQYLNGQNSTPSDMETESDGHEIENETDENGDDGGAGADGGNGDDGGAGERKRGTFQNWFDE